MTSATSCPASWRMKGTRRATARNADEALAAIAARRPQLVLLDIWLQGSRLDGLQVLEIAKRQHPEMPVVMISGHGNIETAVTAIQMGAYDFIEKPFKADRLLLVVERALETSRLRREVNELKARTLQISRLVGSSTAMAGLRRVIERLGADEFARVDLRAGGRRQGDCRPADP